MEIWEELLKEIKSESDKIGSSLADSDNRIGVIELTRAIDHIFVVSSFLTDEDSSNPEDKKWQEAFEIQSLGYYPALHLFLNSDSNQPGFPLFPTTKESSAWAQSCLFKMGYASLLIKYLELSRSGLLSLRKEEENRIKISIPSSQAGYEYKEKLDAKWIQREKVKATKEEPNSTIPEELEENVRVWKDHFIAYDATTKLDLYYKKQGEIYAYWLLGKDQFLSDTKFDGIAYREYRQVLITLIGWILKHRDFCFTLVNKKNEDVDPWNFYTIPIRKDDLISDITDWLKFDSIKVGKIIESLTLTEKNKSSFSGGDAPPPFIKIGKNHLLKSVAGTLSNPFFFLNRMLKEEFPKDYSIAVNERENRFRYQLYNLFTGENFIECNQSINLKEDGKVITDIDAMVFDKNTSVLLLFQLKWMEPFGKNMKERYSRSKNFVSKTTQWKKKVGHWLQNNNPNKLLPFFDEYDSSNFTVRKSLIVIVGRNYAFFSDQTYDQNVAWTNWFKLQKISQEQPEKMKSAKKFYDTILKETPTIKETPKIQDEKIKVGKYEIVVSIDSKSMH